MKLSGRKAIVTGAAQGIGNAIARKLYSEGCTLALLDINGPGAKKAAAEFDGCFGIRCDVSSVPDVSNAVKESVERLGGLDILVNNAGILDSSPIAEVTEALWDRIMAVNLKSVFFMVQQSLPFLKKSGHGRVVNISSVSGRMGGFEAGLGYSASKGGIITLTMGFARQLAPYGITVNAVCPGTTETAILKEFTPETVEKLCNLIPLHRLGKPEDVADAVSFLASDDASFITGLLMDVNGGMYMG